MSAEKKETSSKLREELLKLGHEPAGQLIYTEVLDHRGIIANRRAIRPVFANYLEETGFGKAHEADEVLNSFLESGNKMILMKIQKEGKEEIIGFATLMIGPTKQKMRLNDSYLKKEYRKRGLGNRLNAKRAIIARMEGVPLSGIIPGGYTTKDGKNLQKARPKVFGRIYGVGEEQFSQMKPKQEEATGQLKITNFEKERAEREAEKKRLEKVRKLMKRGSRARRY